MQIKPTSLTSQKNRILSNGKKIYSTDIDKLKINIKYRLPSLKFSSSATKKGKMNRFETRFGYKIILLCYPLNYDCNIYEIYISSTTVLIFIRKECKISVWEKEIGTGYLSGKISSTGQKDMAEPKWLNKCEHNTATLLNCSPNFEITLSF